MKLLVFRFSALGDVALTVPVLQKALQRYPNLEIILVSRPFAKGLVAPLERLIFHPVHLDKNYKGPFGLWKLHRTLLEQYEPDQVIDLHSVVRTRILSLFFKTARIPVFTVNKGREAKRALTRVKNKVRKPLLHTTLRYAKVFEQAGLPLDFDPDTKPDLRYTTSSTFQDYLSEDSSVRHIGIAPFAQHKGKMWPLARMKQLLRWLDEPQYRVLLFGGPGEREGLLELASASSRFIAVADILSLEEEIALMHQLDLMVAMDSSNMHMATLAGLPVVSIWGATHPMAGFGPLGANAGNVVEVPLEKLECRPCSVYGNKPCWRGDYACLYGIEAREVFEKIQKVLTPKE